MADKIARMPPPVKLTDEDLELFEQSCRSVAARYRARGAIREAATWERIADNVAARRRPRCSGKV